MFKKGHKRSKESILKQAETMKGRVNLLAIAKMNSPESNLKKGHKGELHPKWIKDRSKVKSKRTIAEMKWWRKAVFERDDYTCQHCGKKGYKLNADHIKPYILYPELRRDINNGRTLCIDCHKKTPTYARNAKHYVAIP